jgi:hypothetical protein
MTMAYDPTQTPLNIDTSGRNAIATALLAQQPGMGQTNVGGGYVINDPAYSGAPHFYRDYNFQSPSFTSGNDPNDIDYNDLIQGRVTITGGPYLFPEGPGMYTSQQNPGTGNAATYMGQYPAGEPLIGMNGPGQGYQPVPLGMEVPLQSGGTTPATQEMIDNFNSYHMTQQMQDDYNNALGITGNVPQPAGSPGGPGGPGLFPDPLHAGFSNTGNLQDQNLAGQTPTNNNLGLGLTPSDLSGQTGAPQPPAQPAAMGGLAQQAAGGGTAVNPYQGYAPPAPMGGGNPLLQQSEQDLQQPAQGGIYSGFQ